MPAGNLPGQGTSFFCLENDYWRILGLDTAYNSIGPPLLALGGTGAANCRRSCWPGCARSCRRAQPAKPTMLLSHHQYFSGFDREYPLPAQQLEEFFDAPLLWLWGHEHKLAGYRLFGTGKLQVHGRCMGNGGMPVEPSALCPGRPAAARVLFHDGRVNPLYAKDRLGFNGFARLHLRDAELTMEYCSLAAGDSQSPYQEDPSVLLRERFVAGAHGISEPEVSVLTSEPGFVAN